MILNDKTGRHSSAARCCLRCSLSSACTPFGLIQNGTSEPKIPPNGCRCRSRVCLGSKRASSEHAPSIAAARDTFPPVAGANFNGNERQPKSDTAQPGPSSCKLVFGNARHKRRPRSQSQEGIIISTGIGGKQRHLAGSIALLCLAVALIVPLEAACRSTEPVDLSGANSLLNNQSTTQTQTEQSTSLADQIISLFHKPPSTTTTTSTSTSTTSAPESYDAIEEDNGTEEEAIEDVSCTGCDDADAESSASLSADGPAKATNLTDNERLVELQSVFQRKVRQQLMGATRDGMEVFEKLSLSGGCTSNLMSLMSGLGQLKAFAFKFLDASAKIPSGMLYGLLSDYGDFDQCMSIRSNRAVEPEHEAEEGAFSGKYCLMSLKLNYHVKLAKNETVPEGIIEDGILWDDLVRHYWTSEMAKGFQVGMCFPSRCTDDDLNQLYQHVAKSFNVLGEIISCQDNLSLRRQYEPDLLQRTILCGLYALLGLTLIGSLADRLGWPQANLQHGQLTLTIVRVLLCFSITRNWTRFMNGHQREFWSHRLGANSAHLATRCAAERASLANRTSATTTLSDTETDFIDSDPEAPSPSATTTTSNSLRLGSEGGGDQLAQPLSVRIDSSAGTCCSHLASSANESYTADRSLAHLSGLKLLIIIWITVGYSFLYPSANNYQYYRSIIRMNLTRDSVWFATTNFTLGIDMLLYITGLLFVHKLLAKREPHQFVDKPEPANHGSKQRVKAQLANGINSMERDESDIGVLGLISKKALRFWPTYLTVIALAIVVPLISDGPMWPEMVTKKLAESCRHNWWANLLFINNYLGQSDICLPSSWFVSVLMQLFLVGSIIIVLVRKISLEAGVAFLGALLVSSTVFSFCFAYFLKLRAPVIRMDESFVMDLDENLFRLYTNAFNNLGPFLVGMAGGLLLIRAQSAAERARQSVKRSPEAGAKPTAPLASGWLWEILIGLAVATIAMLVLSSVFHENYSQLMSATYWSLHRIGWAIVTGYLVHKCATGKWRLLNDLLSLSAFAPLSRLIFIAYLVYPVYVHIHTGLVRDGLHVSIYNMLNIYITRLVMTFVTALLIHLLVELPFSTIEENYLRKWIDTKLRARQTDSSNQARAGKFMDPSRMMHPLLAVAPKCTHFVAVPNLKMGEQAKSVPLDRLREISSLDELLPAEQVASD